jgi:hypothetical protein
MTTLKRIAGAGVAAMTLALVTAGAAHAGGPYVSHSGPYTSQGGPYVTHGGSYTSHSNPDVVQGGPYATH